MLAGNIFAVISLLHLPISDESAGFDHFFHPLGINSLLAQVGASISALSSLFDREA